MQQPLTKQRLKTLARQLAYALLNPNLRWREHDIGTSLLDMKPGEELAPGMTFSGLQEMGPDGKPVPLSDETKERMRSHHDNVTGTLERRIEIPEGWSPEEAKLACHILPRAPYFKPVSNPIFSARWVI